MLSKLIKHPSRTEVPFPFFFNCNKKKLKIVKNNKLSPRIMSTCMPILSSKACSVVN